MAVGDGVPARRPSAAVGRFRPGRICPHAHERHTITEIKHRLNAEIKVPRVRLIEADGTQAGIVQLATALRSAREQDLDLVEVAPQADPPVCRIMDYGKHRYEEDQKQKEARKKQSQIVIKEIKMRPKISANDYGTKSGHVRRFLNDGAKVKATIMFRGREMSHTELGRDLLDRLAEDMSDLASVEAWPKVDGRNMVMVLAPHREGKPRHNAPQPVETTQEPEPEADSDDTRDEASTVEQSDEQMDEQTDQTTAVADA
ncbi:MAG TPA: translation initiation factor IF-3 [Nitriliruptorales bacterium]